MASITPDPYLEDSSGYRGNAERVFVPSDVTELRQIVLGCESDGVPLTIAGAGTGLTGARVPQGGWVVSLEKFRTIQIEQGRARCGPGAALSDLQKEAARTKQFFGPNPTESSASIGGIISTNAGGARSFHYGAVRHHVLALEVMWMNGETTVVQRGERINFPIQPVRRPATTKNSAGYYLRPDLEWVDLLSGSEGTLGIVTRADLQLLGEPPAVLSGVVFFHSEDDALRAVELWRPLPELRLLEFIDWNGLQLVRSQYPDIPKSAGAALMVEQNLASEEDEEVDLWTERLRQQAAFEEESWFGFRTSDHMRFREFRHTLATTVVDTVRRNGFLKLGTDFAVPVARNRELHSYYKRRCEEALPGKYTIYGHIGDANNHVNLLPTTAEEARSAEEMIYEFAKYVVALGGTVAAEHGIGKSKTHLLKLMYSAEEIEAMRDVKRRLDPDWLLGQGNIFDRQ